MTISHVEVRRHPLWRKEAAMGARESRAAKGAGVGLVLIVVGAVLLVGGIYLLVVLNPT